MKMKLINHSYNNDCIFLLKDLSHEVREITLMEKEKLIRAGVNYSEVISKEDKPSYAVKKIFFEMLDRDKTVTAFYVAKISEIMYKEKKDDLVIVSLARAGTPYGILVKKYLKYKFNIDIPHYSISVIRGKGIDFNALKYILREHEGAKIQFVDGWTGKGSITKELKKSIKIFNESNNCNIDSSLAVISDPAKLCNIYGTRMDFALASSCLNATISGLISRTIHNKKYIGKFDFHGAKILEYLRAEDVSQQFIDIIYSQFKSIQISEKDLVVQEKDEDYSINITNKIKDLYGVNNINNIKLSAGESARVLLRREPKVVLVKDKRDKNIQHILKLAEEKKVNVIEYKESDYKCIAIIKE